MSVGVMKDEKVKLRDLHSSDTDTLCYIRRGKGVKTFFIMNQESGIYTPRYTED